MALKKLLARKEADKIRRSLEALTTKEEALGEKREALVKREAECEKSIDEADVDNDEEMQAVQQEAGEIEKEAKKLKTDEEEVKKEREELEKKLEEIERELDTEDPTEAPQETVETEKDEVKREMRKNYTIRGLSMAETDAFMARSEVKTFIDNVRNIRNVQGAQFAIPETVFDIVNENILHYSKLLPIVRVENFAGRGRLNIIGEYPEAVWTEACGTLNEVNFKINTLELDGYKVGAYVFVCKAAVEDSDTVLINSIVEGLSESIGKAIDKAILYGDGKKKPMGIVTRLTQETKPEGYPLNAPEWKNLTSGHVVKIDGKKTTEKVGELVKATGVLKEGNNMFWAMNPKTLSAVKSDLVYFNANGAIVAQIDGTMPVLGGKIVTLDFIPDGDIIGGYGSAYVVLNRKNIEIDTNDRVQWVEDNIGYKATARLDGQPAVPQAFIAFNYNGVDVTKTVPFAEDKANTAKGL